MGQAITPELSQALDLKNTQGTLVSQVMERSLAEKSGIRAGDVLIDINGRPITSPSSMRNAIGLIPVGDTISLTLLRDNEKKMLKITMVDPKTLVSVAQEIYPGLAGIELGEVHEAILGHGFVKGLRVLGVYSGSPAAQEGLQAGDIIVLANKKAISTVQDLKDAINSPTDPLLIRVLRDQVALFMVIQGKEED